MDNSVIDEYLSHQNECRKIERDLTKELADLFYNTLKAHPEVPMVMVDSGTGKIMPYNGKGKVVQAQIGTLEPLYKQVNTILDSVGCNQCRANDMITNGLAWGKIRFCMVGINGGLINDAYGDLIAVNPYYDFHDKIRSSLQNSIEDLDLPAFSFKSMENYRRGLHVVDELPKSCIGDSAALKAKIHETIAKVFYGSEHLKDAYSQYDKMIDHAYLTMKKEDDAINNIIACSNGVSITTGYDPDIAGLETRLDKSGHSEIVSEDKTYLPHKIKEGIFIGSDNKHPKVSKAYTESKFAAMPGMIKFYRYVRQRERGGGFRSFGSGRSGKENTNPYMYFNCNETIFLKSAIVKTLPGFEVMGIPNSSYYGDGKTVDRLVINMGNLLDKDYRGGGGGYGDETTSQGLLILDFTKGGQDDLKRMLVDEQKVMTIEQFNSVMMDLIL